MDKWVSGKGAFDNINIVQKLKKSLVQLALLKTFFVYNILESNFGYHPMIRHQLGQRGMFKVLLTNSDKAQSSRQNPKNRGQIWNVAQNLNAQCWSRNIGEKLTLHAAQCSQKLTIKNIPQRLTSRIFEGFFLTQSITIYSTIFKHTPETRFSDPRFSEILDLVNQTQLPSYFTKYHDSI